MPPAKGKGFFLQMVKRCQITVARSMAVLIALTLLLEGCAHDTRVDVMQRQIQDMTKNLDELKKEVETLKRDSSWDRFTKDWEGIAYLTPGDEGYSVVKTDFGPLTVTLEDIKPYANGSRVSLKFGNPTSATLTDVSATVEWGSVDEKGSPRINEGKSKELPFNKSFQAGHWTTAEVVLDGIPPANLGFIRIRDLKNKGIRLNRICFFFTSVHSVARSPRALRTRSNRG
jgi:outer membrane murein-binding lipoprotein Lpp